MGLGRRRGGTPDLSRWAALAPAALCIFSGSLTCEDEVQELAQWDAVRVAPQTMRCLEGGPDGAEVLAFGAPNNDNKDAELVPGWWSD